MSKGAIIRIIVIAVIVLALAWLIFLSPWHESIQGSFSSVTDSIGTAFSGIFGGSE